MSRRDSSLWLYAVNGTLRPIEPTFEAARRAVGGYVQPVSLPGGDYFLCDEDGDAKELPLNEVASALARLPIVGPVVLVPKALVRTVLG